MFAEQTTIAIGRRLTSAQAERRGRVLEVVRELASEGGYDAVTISAVCERAGVARATAYHYFGSKDHMIAEVMVRWGHEQRDDLRRDPPSGDSTLERVLAMLRRTLDRVVAEPELFSAAVKAFVSPDLGVGETQRQLRSLVAGYLDAALASDDTTDHATLGMVLGHVFFSSLVHMAAGRATADEVMDDLATTASIVILGSKATKNHGEAK
jgi:AcrR family transcriptional regulator